MPEIGTKIMMNVGTPEQAFTFAQLPNAGVGLARLEFIINRQIGIHPKALLGLDDLDEPLKSQIQESIAAYAGPREFFVQRVAEGISTIAAAFAPRAGDRADERLQVQRVRQPRRRRAVRARTRRTR